MAIKKDAAKADIGPKKQVKATFAECTAEEPLKCKYHGLKALDNLIGNVLASTGHPMPFVTDKHEGEYELRLPSDIDLPLSAYDKVVKALHDRGFQIVNKGVLDNGAFQYQIKPSDGKGFVTPDGEAELEDADTLSSTEAPEKKETPSDTDEVDDLEGSHEDEIPDDMWDVLVEAFDLDEKQLNAWKGMVHDYKSIDGNPLTSKQAESVDNILSVFSGIEPIQKAWEETKKKHQQQAQSQEPKQDETGDAGDDAEAYAELDADLEDNFDDMEEVTEDMESEVLGNGDFDDIIFSEVDENLKPQELDEQDIKELMLLQGIQPSYFATHDDLMPEYKAIISTGKNKSGTDLSPSQKAWWGTLINEVKKQGLDNPAAKQLLKSFGKDGDEGKNKEITKEDCVALMSAAGHEVDNYPDDAAEQWYHLFTTGKNAYGVPISGNVLANWKKIAEKAEQSGEELAALPVLKRTLAKIEASGSSGKPIPTMDDIMAEMTSVVDKIHQTGLVLTWDANKGNALGKAFEDAVNAKDVDAAQVALDNFKDYIHKLESGEETEEDEPTYTDDELLDAAAKKWYKTKAELKNDPQFEMLKYAIDHGLWQSNGEVLNEKNKKVLQDLADIAGPDSGLAKKIKQTLDKIESGEIGGGDDLKAKYQDLVNEANASGMFNQPLFTKKFKKISAIQMSGDYASAVSMLDKLVHPKKFSLKAIKDFIGTHKGWPPIGDVPKEVKKIKELLEKGSLDGTPISDLKDLMKYGLVDKYKMCADGPIKDALLTALGAKSANASSSKKAGGSAKKAILQAFSESGHIMKSGDLLEPLEHDESKFPPSVTKEQLEKLISSDNWAGSLKEALEQEKSYPLGGASGDNAMLVHIDHKPYVVKGGTGSHAEHIHNEVMADQAYRAGGIRAPDCKEYNLDGKTYKLAEFINGKSLYDYMDGATEAQKKAVRRDLLQGFPLDVLFSNWDVIGSNRDNILVDDEGHAWRIDNGGSFSMAAQSNSKSMEWAVENYIKKPESKGEKPLAVFENWDEEGGWENRQWIDDFRTMRIDAKNKGLFDGYTTADIFLSAGNVDLGKAVESIQDEGIRKALEKPLFEMKQMTFRALNMQLGGYKNDAFVSMALDASYEASKRGLREDCDKDVGWNDAGYGEWKDSWGSYQKKPFGEKKPEPPKDPKKALNNMLDNDDYTGTQVASILLTAIKSINYHGGVKQKDANGNPVGNGSAQDKPDYKPNEVAIAQYEKIDRDKLAELAKTDDNAKKLLDFYDLVKYSQDNGWKKPIGAMPMGLSVSAKLPDGYQSPYEKKLNDDLSGAVAQFEKDMEAYKKDLADYQKRLDAHNKKEAANAVRAGSSPYHGFMDFADTLIKDGINSYGISHTVATSGIEPIETSMVDQKGNSYKGYAKDWKVRLWQAMGYTLSDIKKKLADGTFINGEQDGESVSDIIEEHAEGDPDKWESDFASQAMFCGLQMLYLENSRNAMFDKESGVVFVNRNIPSYEKVQGLTAKEQAIYSDPDASGWVGPHPYAAADCMQFEMNDWGGDNYNCQVYALPFANLICCSNMSNASGTSNLTGGYGGENEYVGNLNNQPCWVYHKGAGLSWKGAIDEAKKSKGMKSWLKKLATRLNPFNTLKS